MTNPQPEYDPDAPDLDSHPLAEPLRALRADLNPPDATLRRLEQRMHATVSAQPRPAPSRQAARRAGGWLGRLGGGRVTAVVGLLLAVIAGAALLRILPNRSVSAAEILRRATEYANQPIAPGTVRHVVYEGVATDPRGTQRFIDEIWLTPGTNHLLVMQPARRPVPGSALLDPIGAVVIDEKAVWTVDPTAQTVTKAPFSEVCSLEQSDWLGDAALVATLAKAPGVTVAGAEVINGRETTRLGWGTYTVWFETTSGRLVRFDDSATGTSYQKTILVDEVLDRRAVPADRFTFAQPAGTTLVVTQDPCT